MHFVRSATAACLLFGLCLTGCGGQTEPNDVAQFCSAYQTFTETAVFDTEADAEAAIDQIKRTAPTEISADVVFTIDTFARLLDGDVIESDGQELESSLSSADQRVKSYIATNCT